VTDAEQRRFVAAVRWISVPRGLLQRGTPATEIDAVVRAHADLGLPRSYFAKEAPRQAVEVAAFTIAATPVTSNLWSAISRTTSSMISRCISPCSRSRSPARSSSRPWLARSSHLAGRPLGVT
jgi:formylglycine-generating enzyme required for sulfatase activity